MVKSTGTVLPDWLNGGRPDLQTILAELRSLQDEINALV